MIKEEKLIERMARTVRIGLCTWQDLQSLETYDSIAKRLLKDIKHELYGEYIK